MVIPDLLKFRKELSEWIVKECHIIFIARCIKKELKAKHRHLLNLWYSLFVTLKRKIQEKNAKPLLSYLPACLERSMERYSASECDKMIASLAYDRCKRGGSNKVLLISRDPCFLELSSVFERYGISIIKPCDFLKNFSTDHNNPKT